MPKKIIAVRKAVPADAAALAEIYRPYVENTAVSFEYTAPAAEEFARRMEKILQKYPYFVAVENCSPVGYAYAGPFKDRAAYDVSAELSVYVAPGCQGRGVGTLLYKVLEKALTKQGVTNAYACIAYPDGREDETLSMQSVNFHYARGYCICGYYKNCGVKFGRRYSMVWMEKTLSGN